MSTLTLYRGVWPQNVSKLAKYAVRFTDGTWKVAVLYEAGEGLRYLAVEGGATDVATRVNAVKTAQRDQPGGAFYVNEYRHIIVPVTGDAASGTGSSLTTLQADSETDFRFEFRGSAAYDGSRLDRMERRCSPRRAAGSARAPGNPLLCARCCGGGDIYYETPALTDVDIPRRSVPRDDPQKVQLSKILGNKSQLGEGCYAPIAGIFCGHQGGRF